MMQVLGPEKLSYTIGRFVQLSKGDNLSSFGDNDSRMIGARGSVDGRMVHLVSLQQVWSWGGQQIRVCLC